MPMKKMTDKEWLKNEHKEKSKNWIQAAHIKKGAFTAKADKAGKSVAAEASSVLAPGSKASAKTKKQAVLAKTFSKMAKK